MVGPERAFCGVHKPIGIYSEVTMAWRLGFCVLLVASLAVSYAPCANGIVQLARIALDARIDGTNSIEEVEAGGALGSLVRHTIAHDQFNSVSETCQSAAKGLLRACLQQYTYLVRSFGQVGRGHLFPPGFTEDMLTPDFLAGLPEPNRRCCRYAVDFQSNFCACYRDVILAFRNFGYFDPSLTMPFANYLYGEKCGAATFLADDCPNGSPFLLDD